MYDDAPKKSFFTYFLFVQNKLLILLAISAVVVVVNYLFDFRVEFNPYFEIQKQSLGKEKEQENWRVEKVGEHFVVSGKTLRIVNEQGEEVSFPIQGYPLSTQCLVSSLQVSKLQGIIVGCVDGTVQILRLIEEEISMFERQYRQLSAAVLGSVWDGSDVVILALHTDSKSSEEETNNVDFYRYALRSGTWDLRTQLKRAFHITQFDSFSSIQGGSLFLNSDAGIEKIRGDSITRFAGDAIMKYAGGHRDFYLLHGASKDKEFLRFFINNDLVELQLFKDLGTVPQEIEFAVDAREKSRSFTLGTERDTYQIVLKNE